MSKKRHKNKQSKRLWTKVADNCIWFIIKNFKLTATKLSELIRPNNHMSLAATSLSELLRPNDHMSLAATGLSELIWPKNHMSEAATK